MAKKTVKKAPKKIAKQSQTKKTKAKRFSFKQKLISVIILVLIVAVAGGIYCWKKDVTNPDKVLNAMLSGSLHTTSVTRVVSQAGATQALRFNFESEPFVRSKTEITQAGPNGKNGVTTESIGTKNADFVRYTDITTNGQPSPGVQDVLNIWASNRGMSALGSQAVFLNQAGLSVIPFANLSDQDAQKILNIMTSKHIYNYSKAQLKWVNNRPVMYYDISIKPVDIITMLKVYQEVTGIGDPTQLSPDLYANANDLNVTIAVDVLSRQLTNISYPDSQRNEDYNGYGINNDTTVPERAISINDLQSRIQNLAKNQAKQNTGN